jgi:prevent-host-death family protein
MTTVTMVEYRNKLGELAKKIYKEKERVIITSNEIPLLVTISYEDFTRLMETIDMLEEAADPEYKAQLAEGRREYVKGKTLSHEEMKKAAGL